ncbi:hypothetical protein RJ640_014074 [Escallonia rubra]|uniref:Pectinesterase inhibitor domain-containing protein n=1 Tax=Escallonia rubra TaxID=112253 RepID=A0AA88UHQ9_9ASTE|nr:hypothetical protein RJ640_014074 [Escallonia rubra]
MGNLVFVQWRILVFIICFVSPSFARMNLKDASLIESVCKRTTYHDLCVSSLRSNPHSAGADVKGLAHIMLELFFDKTKDNFVEVKKLQSAATDPIIQECLRICSEQYSMTIDSFIPAAFKDLESNSISDAIANTAWAYGGPETCEEAFTEQPTRPSPLTARNNYKRKQCVPNFNFKVDSNECKDVIKYH